MNKIELIKQAITKAANNQSKLTEEILQLPSFSSAKNKHLLNNLGDIGTHYLEVGIHKAGMFIAASFGNQMKSIAIDNYSQFQEGGVARELAYRYCVKYLPHDTYTIVENDCFEIPIHAYPFKIDFYTYDGEHGYDNQKKGLLHFLPILEDEFIFVCDDFSWQDPKRGTYDGIKEAGLKILYEQVLWDGIEGGMYHNGIGVFLLQK